MLATNVISVPAGESAKLSFKIDFQKDTCIGTIIPISEDEVLQVSARFIGNFKWSLNNKYWITEQICDSASVSSSGEVLITTIQGPYVSIEVNNKELVDQKFFIAFNVPSTSSNAV